MHVPTKPRALRCVPSGRRTPRASAPKPSAAPGNRPLPGLPVGSERAENAGKRQAWERPAPAGRPRPGQAQAPGRSERAGAQRGAGRAHLAVSPRRCGVQAVPGPGAPLRVPSGRGRCAPAPSAAAAGGLGGRQGAGPQPARADARESDHVCYRPARASRGPWVTWRNAPPTAPWGGGAAAEGPGRSSGWIANGILKFFPIRTLLWFLEDRWQVCAVGAHTAGGNRRSLILPGPRGFTYSHLYSWQ